MPSIYDLSGTPRRQLNVFYVLDASESMQGAPIATLNTAMIQTIAGLKDVAAHNSDALVKIAVLEYNSGCRWLTGDKAPEELENFRWRKLTAGERSDIGAALKELNSKLSRHSFLHTMTGGYVPVIIFGVGSSATDSYRDALEQIRQNRWFMNAKKIGYAVGEAADEAMLTEIVGGSDAVITLDDLESFVKRLEYLVWPPTTECLLTTELTGKDIVALTKEIVVDSFKNAMLKVIDMAGKEILKDKSRMNAYLSDVAPDYGKEIHIFAKSCDSSLLELFYELDKADDAQRSQTIRRARQILIQKEGLDEAWADTLVDALVYALNGRQGFPDISDDCFDNEDSEW